MVIGQSCVSLNWGWKREEGVDDDKCHCYDFLVRLWNGLNFF